MFHNFHKYQRQNSNNNIDQLKSLIKTTIRIEDFFASASLSCQTNIQQQQIVNCIYFKISLLYL